MGSIYDASVVVLDRFQEANLTSKSARERIAKEIADLAAKRLQKGMVEALFKAKNRNNSRRIIGESVD
ncbi:MAG: hypothetical protein K9J12_12475 [Melioribacteraceae bacterium]|nr:hypothetical protein [Melioribacteraceae bacterium]MCF8265835.1 hypothetical protein [Melioribacteraceae bacterium]MCF8414531.1 hypothetical protein [Melioribacteraceae bacterium]